MRVEKFDVAKAQLETAVWIFLNGLDRSSVCTLAGAVSGILDNLVKRTGKESFVDYARRIHQSVSGHTPKRQSYIHHIEKKLGITPNKHLSINDADGVEIDLEASARDALIRAMADYTLLTGQDEPFVKAFFQYCWSTMDGAAIMKNSSVVPTKMWRKTLRMYSRLQLAAGQLETALALFISGRDRFSVITLAGAADVILSQLLIRDGKSNFTDHMIAAAQAKGEEHDATRQSHGKKINDLLLINAFKHLDDGCEAFLDIENLEETALATVLKALPNYMQLEGHDKVLVAAFRMWMVKNLDPKRYNVHGAADWTPPV
jgi:hypothetical protein